MFGTFRKHSVRLSRDVGPGRANDQRDLSQVDVALKKARTLAPTVVSGNPAAAPGRDRAIRRFQRLNGLTPDGWLRPDGPTERALNRVNLHTTSYRPMGRFSPPLPLIPAETIRKAGESIVDAFDRLIPEAHPTQLDRPRPGSSAHRHQDTDQDPLFRFIGPRSEPRVSRPGSSAHRDYMPPVKPDPLHNRRGNEQTRKWNDVVTQELGRITSRCPIKIDHKGGANRWGLINSLEEYYIPSADGGRKGANFMDISMFCPGEDGNDHYLHINTVDTRKRIKDRVNDERWPGDPIPIDRETHQADKAEKNCPAHIPKGRRGPGTTKMLLIPKSVPGQQADLALLADQLRPHVSNLVDRCTSPDPRQPNPFSEYIYPFRQESAK